MVKSNCMEIKLFDLLRKTNKSHSSKQISNVSLPYMDDKYHVNPNRCINKNLKEDACAP
jgi:hypothetical protein